MMLLFVTHIKIYCPELKKNFAEIYGKKYKKVKLFLEMGNRQIQAEITCLCRLRDLLEGRQDI